MLRPEPFRSCVLLALLLGFAPEPAAATALFLGLGDLPGGSFESRANAVADGGAAVVGLATTDAGPVAFRWTPGGGMAALGASPDGLANSEANDLSRDGSVVVGNSLVPLSGGGPVEYRAREAFRWTAASGIAGMGDLGPGLPPGAPPIRLISGVAVSPDGRLVTGDFIDFTVSANYLHDSVTGNNLKASNLGPNCCLDVGRPTSVTNSGIITTQEAFGTISFQLVPPYGSQNVEVLSARSVSGSSSDARFVVGFDGLGRPALAEVGASSPILLGTSGFTVPTGVSDGGSRVVGWSRLTGQSAEAFLWTPEDGMRPLSDVLATEFGLAGAFEGWGDVFAADISYDGLAITGYGTNPEGNVEAWIVVIPEPATAWLLCVGLGALAARRRAQPFFRA